MTGTPKVLFVCTHNAGRSQMAAALLDHQAAGRIRVTSAGSQPASQLNPAVSPQLQEIVCRALERDPRHRYATASEMAWELEHQEQVGVEEGARRPALRHRLMLDTRRMLLYAGLALAPVTLFVIMLLLAKR